MITAQQQQVLLLVEYLLQRCNLGCEDLVECTSFVCGDLLAKASELASASLAARPLCSFRSFVRAAAKQC